jgi:hypothetical protein
MFVVSRMNLVATSLLLIFGTTCFADDGSPPVLGDLDSSDVEWLTSIFGVGPKISVRARSVLEKITKEDIGVLVQMTADRRRFVIAHVLLARIYLANHKVKKDSYCGLEIDFDDKGNPSYPTYSPTDLKNYWEEMRKSQTPVFQLDRKE